MKTVTIKSTKIKWSLLLLLMTFFIYSCDKDDAAGTDDGDVEQNNGISADDLESYAGDIGILISARDIAKRGYEPMSINITTEAEEGNYDQQLIIDPFTNLAQLKMSVESLTEEAEAELRNGVPMTISVLNPSGNTIISESYSLVSFEENGAQINMNATSLAYLPIDLFFREGSRHYLQAVNANGNYNNKIVWKPSGALDNNVILEERISSFNQGTTSEQYFIHKFTGQENTFALWSANSGRYLATDSNDKTFRQSGVYSYPDGINDNSLHPRYRFIIQREANGLYTVNDIDGNPMRRYANGSKNSWRTNTTGTIQYFRIITLDIEWQPQILETNYLQPILPAVETSFGFNSTLRNCGAGTLEQEVGIESEITTIFTTSFEESVGLSSRVTTSVEASVSATAEASFFGNGGSVTGEVSAGLEVSVEANSTTTTGVEESTSETTTVSSTRTVMVPAGSASLVYDAYQTYSNVRVPYVQRVRLRGTDSESGQTLSGQDILTQLIITSFSGTITNVGPDYVEITIRGNMFLDNMVDTQTEVRDVPANCG